MTKDEALKLALDALKEINNLSIGENAISLPAEIDTAMDAIKEVLAQPPEERNFCPRCGKRAGKNAWDVHTCSLPEPEPPPECATETEKKAFAFGWFKAMEAQRLAQHDSVQAKPEPEQKPAFWYDRQHKDFSHVQRLGWEPLYTTPPQRTWVGLTEDEAFACQGRDYFETYKAIEAKLKQKNGYAEEKNT